MHPAFSVLLFSTLSGAGYGLLAWTMLLLAFERPGALMGNTPLMFLGLLAAAAVLFTVGLLSSLGHLGQPRRAWRAFSQWRTSWLSREGVMAVLVYLPVLALAWWLSAPLRGIEAGAGLPDSVRWVVWAALLAALGTVVCTAMIYASLKPIPAWRHPLVLPVYLGFALLCGLLLMLLGQRLAGGVAIAPLLVVAAMLAGGVSVLKVIYWWRIDRKPLPVTRASALGLPAGREASVFERPHTEANYLTTEMGFVLARKHARKLRVIALLLFGLVPLLCCWLAWMVPEAATPVLAVAVLASLLGALVERWLFFAEARHLVMLYY
ncbi:MAG: DMSO reductase [Arenimonas sp.]|jgi:DMSO reductase anchor subunit|nr:DMSO reductase [Arenimonas sp.]